MVAIIDKGRTLKRATVASGEVTAGQGVMSTLTVGAATQQASSAAACDRARPRSCAKPTDEAESIVATAITDITKQPRRVRKVNLSNDS